jgi:hypothetical protein
MRWRLAGPAEKARRAMDVGELVCEEQHYVLLWASGGHGTQADWVGGVSYLSAHRTRSERVRHAICAKWECDLACCAAGNWVSLKKRGSTCGVSRKSVHISCYHPNFQLLP